MTAQKHTPDRIRVAQDADGFWTCREAVSGSQEYVRADIVDDLLATLKSLRNECSGKPRAHMLPDLLRQADGAIARAEVRA